MRRTSAGALHDPTKPWAELKCDACLRAGITIMAMTRAQNGMRELAFCGPQCAKLAGWPWLRAEHTDVAAMTVRK